MLCLSTRLRPRSTRTNTLFPSTTLFRSSDFGCASELINARCHRHQCACQRTPARAVASLSADCLVAPRQGHLNHLCGAARGNSARYTRSEEQTSELQPLMRISYAVFCLKKQAHHRQWTQPALNNTHLHHTSDTENRIVA